MSEPQVTQFSRVKTVIPAGWREAGEDAPGYLHDEAGEPWLVVLDEHDKPCLLQFNPDLQQMRQRYLDEHGVLQTEWLYRGITMNPRIAIETLAPLRHESEQVLTQFVAEGLTFVTDSRLDDPSYTCLRGPLRLHVSQPVLSWLAGGSGARAWVGCAYAGEDPLALAVVRVHAEDPPQAVAARLVRETRERVKSMAAALEP